jgi:hypothetical protein
MKNRIYISALLICLLCGTIGSVTAAESKGEWTEIETGLFLGLFESPLPSEQSENPIRIIKLDPNYFEIDLFCASKYGNRSRTLKEWAEEFNLLATVNAGMFGTDLMTSIGYLKSGEHINNPIVNGGHKAILACQPMNSELPPFQIIDLNCDRFENWEDKYHSFLQSIRMISCRHRNVWQQQDKRWSISAAGIDSSGNLLLIHSRLPYSVHDFINVLLELPLHLYNAMYLEGGPQAGLYFSAGGVSQDIHGASVIDLFLNGSTTNGWAIPNVIGVTRRNTSPK